MLLTVYVQYLCMYLAYFMTFNPEIAKNIYN